MRAVRLTGVVLADAKMTNVAFVECRIDMSSMRFSHLEQVVFENCLMQDADLSSASLSSVMFRDCDLAKASLAETTVVQSEMRGCDLDGIKNPEQLRGVGMPWDDILRNAPVIAAAAGIHVADDA